MDCRSEKQIRLEENLFSEVLVDGSIICGIKKKEKQDKNSDLKYREDEDE